MPPRSSNVSRTGLPIVVDTQALSRLARDLRAAGPASAAAFRGAMRDSAKIVRAEAEQRASFSNRIPQSMTSRATPFNFKVTAGGEKAPDAAAIENRGKGYVRHPVFGDRENWTAKNSHPAFLAPALAAKADDVVELIADRLTAAVAAVLGD